jgi:hypothetical protein
MGGRMGLEGPGRACGEGSDPSRPLKKLQWQSFLGEFLLARVYFSFLILPRLAIDLIEIAVIHAEIHIQLSNCPDSPLTFKLLEGGIFCSEMVNESSRKRAHD